MHTLHIRLFGDFALISSDKTSHAPTSKKAIGLLALLATSESGSRQRRWLEDKLWSDRGPSQARGSLRATLVVIRKALGAHAHFLGADRTSVWLDLNAISTDLDQQDFSREFLEGLDVADEEFNAWLMQQRMMRDQPRIAEQSARPVARRLSIQCGMPWATSSTTSIKSQIVSTQIGKIISDFIAYSRCSNQDTRADLVIKTSVEDHEDGATLLVQIIDPVADEIIHSDHCFTSNLDLFVRSQALLGRFCWNLADLALEKVPAQSNKSDPLSERSAYVQSALRHVLSFDPTQMHKSLSVLDEASNHLEMGLFFAFKAWAMTSMIMEGFLEESKQTLEEIKMLLIKAQERSPSEGMVAAVCANVECILFENHQSAIALARRALRETPNNIFALQAMSASRAATGQMDIAYELSKHGQFVSSLSKFSAMSNLHHALLCISMHRSSEAVQSSENAAKLAPTYRAPRRQLLGLYAAGNNRVEAQIALNGLRDAEPDFELDRYLFDRSYPSNTLRKSGYLDKAIIGMRDE